MKEQRSSLGKAVLFVGLLGLAHSFYSTIQHLSYLKAIRKDVDGLPLDIILECIFCTLISLVGVCMVSLNLHDITLEAEAPFKTIASVDNSPSYITFQHRAKTLGSFTLSK